MATLTGVAVRCPACLSDVADRAAAFMCDGCGRSFPVICGIPDFRLEPDPYIGLDSDRAKGAALWEACQAGSYEAAVRYYYAITPEDPPDLAERWTARSLAEIAIARSLLSDAALVGTPSADRSPRTLLDVGCSTGALLIAARSEYSRCIGVDVAFRWLVLGQIRLREAGVNAPLICANAGHLPFADGTVETVTAADLLEHVRDAPRAVREVARVLKPGGDAVWTTNNRFAPVPEPHVKLWGVGWLPRRWQPAYVARRRRDLLPYAIRLRSARELRRLFERAGFASVTIEPAPLMAPHIRRQAVQLALRAHNRMRRWPVAESLLRALGPRLWVRAVR